MGISGSKLATNPIENPISDEQGSIPSTPILTPKVSRENIEKENFDPRSPSRHIARTPIELLCAAADKLASLTIDTGDSNGLAVETPLKRHLILGIDPRSPTLELQRTPIVVSADKNSPDKKLPAKIRNKNLDKARSSALLSTPKGVPPKLLDSSPVTRRIRPDAYKRKSFVLLETNIDFTETDLDTVIKEKYLGNSLQNLSTVEDVSFCEIIDPRSPTIDFLRTPVQVLKSKVPLADKLDDIEHVEVIEHLVQNVDSNNIIEEVINVVSDEATVLEESSSIVNKYSESVALSPVKSVIVPVESCNQENDNSPVKYVTIAESSEQESIESLEGICNERESENSDDVIPVNADLNTDLIFINEVAPVEDNIDNQDNNDCNVSLIPLVEYCINNEEDNGVSIHLDNDHIQNANSEADDNPNQNLCLSSTPKQEPHIVPKSAPVSPPIFFSATPKKSKSQPVTPPLIDLTADVKELDKKLSNLIYEDEDLIVCPRVVKIKEQSRTPLGVRNGTENRKTIQKLKVSDKPRKAEYVVSKIPVFKEKKIKVQCENTPPRGMRGGKSKTSKWDSKDDTLVI